MADEQDGNSQNENGGTSTPSTEPTTPEPKDEPRQPADGKVIDRENSDGTKSHFDIAGDEVEKDKNGNWVKKKQ